MRPPAPREARDWLDWPFFEARHRALAERLASVLEVVYLVFNEGYTATSGPSWSRPALCAEAMRLGRMLCGLAPDEPEADETE